MNKKKKGLWATVKELIKKAWNWIKKVIRNLTGMVKDTSISKNEEEDDNKGAKK
ncbi:MAG: hypothetical protein GY940_07545 [bacterium]|nr:hypothetical protein [bacterium]